MPRVRYDGRGRLAVFGHELAEGQVAEMSDEEAAQLAANPHVQVTVLGVTVHGHGVAAADEAIDIKKTTKKLPREE